MSIVVADCIVPGKSGVLKIGKTQSNAPNDDVDATDKSYVDSLLGPTSTTLTWTGPTTGTATILRKGRWVLMQLGSISVSNSQGIHIQANWASVNPPYEVRGVARAYDGTSYQNVYLSVLANGNITFDTLNTPIAFKDWTIYPSVISWISN